MMNRPIKIRIWDKKDSKWVKPHELIIEYDGRLKLPGIGDKWYEFVQFTGLKDKNGREIYEGDIVNYAENKLYGNGSTMKGVFVYHEWMARFHIEDSRGSWDPFYTWNGTQQENDGSSIIEIIGNIYENPKLLK